jgi:hypothetical protein
MARIAGETPPAPWGLVALGESRTRPEPFELLIGAPPEENGVGGGAGARALDSFRDLPVELLIGHYPVEVPIWSGEVAVGRHLVPHHDPSWPAPFTLREGRYVLPAFGLCGRCGEICDRDLDLEIFRSCIACQADLVELAVALHLETEVE